MDSFRGGRPSIRVAFWMNLKEKLKRFFLFLCIYFESRWLIAFISSFFLSFSCRHFVATLLELVLLSKTFFCNSFFLITSPILNTKQNHHLQPTIICSSIIAAIVITNSKRVSNAQITLFRVHVEPVSCDHRSISGLDFNSESIGPFQDNIGLQFEVFLCQLRLDVIVSKNSRY